MASPCDLPPVVRPLNVSKWNSHRVAAATAYSLAALLALAALGAFLARYGKGGPVSFMSKVKLGGAIGFTAGSVLYLGLGIFLHRKANRAYQDKLYHLGPAQSRTAGSEDAPTEEDVVSYLVD